MPYVEITVQTDPLQQEILQGFLYSFPIGGLVVHDPADRIQVKNTAPAWVVVEDDVLGDTDAPVTLQMYVEEKEADRVLPRVEAYLQKNPEQGRIIGVRSVDEESWADSWKKYFKPLPVGERLLIKPTWEKAEKTDRIILSIDPGMAFGSGTHETTQLCLEALERIPLYEKRVADIGCGSGILSIAAALFGAEHVQAVDIEPMSIRMTGENAALNQVASIVHAKESHLLEGIAPPVDVLVSNILAEILVQMVPAMESVLADHAYIVFSGIIEEKKNEVSQALQQNGYRLIHEKTDNGWVVIVAEFQR